MSPSRRVLLSALSIISAFSLSAAAVASGQTMDDTRRSLGLAPDPIARSPRLLGMGGVSLTVDDPHNRINLWDFAAFPTGVVDADSNSVIELRPATASASSVHDLSGLERGRERQDLALRENRFGFEIWRRSGMTTFGAVGDLDGLRHDEPYSDDTEHRRRLSQPNIVPLVAGRLPYTTSGNSRFALRVHYRTETVSEKYLTIVENGAGQYLDLHGETLNPPDYFTPDETRTSSLGAGLAISHRVASWLTVGVGVDEIANRIRGGNHGIKYDSQIHEDRDVTSGQATLIGRIGPHFEWGADGRGWSSTSEQHWAFSLSAGPAANAVDGRGKLDEREEKGNSLNTRARLTLGPLQLGAAFGSFDRKITLTPPDPSDPTSLNQFLRNVYSRPSGDTLNLPDSVSYNQITTHSWNAGGGVGLRMGTHARWAAEYHVTRDREEMFVTGGTGPERRAWDVRSGLEWKLNPVLMGRVGYQYAWLDRDLKIQQNESKGNSMTLGLGLRPDRAAWSFDAGYLIHWSQADYGSPWKPRGSRQLLSSQVRWDF